ncbi:preprotein translocase subunit Sec61beta [Candidatus Parvarchaeota archaeon]|nr:preprotein translocase subunit Sec61beta [Candidatus Parvarchaeota archaeon]
MSLKRVGFGMPQSSAGILGISIGENLQGLKMDPRMVVIFTAVFVLAVIVLGKAFGQ